MKEAVLYLGTTFSALSFVILFAVTFLCDILIKTDKVLKIALDIMAWSMVTSILLLAISINLR